MAAGLKTLRELQARLQKAKLGDHSTAFNTTRLEMLELDNLMATAIATAELAFNRKESRGAHARNDFKNRDDKNWLKHSLYFEDGAIDYREVNRKPNHVDPIPLKLRDEGEE